MQVALYKADVSRLSQAIQQMVTSLSGTSQNILILGFEMLFQEDYESLDLVSGLIISPTVTICHMEYRMQQYLQIS